VSNVGPALGREDEEPSKVHDGGRLGFFWPYLDSLVASIANILDEDS